jgi:pimeloyl-ACP methyl ester carboxylesterase
MIEKTVNIRWIFALIFGLLIIGCNESRTTTRELEPAQTPIPNAETGLDEPSTSESPSSESPSSESPTAESLTVVSPTVVSSTVDPDSPSLSSTVETFMPEFQPDRCQFEVPSRQTVSCGYLRVPENHYDPTNGRTLRLHVAIFQSEHPDPPPDPIIYLAGGPGADALEAIQFEFENVFAPLLADRDLILFDQRGTGYSEPSLACPEVVDVTYETLDLALRIEEVAEQNTQALAECRNRLLSEDVNLTAYNSVQSASDVNALRHALGYEEWNLYGASYGTRLAQTIMREHPDGLRSVVLDSVYPIAADMYSEIPANVWRAMELFFSGCQSDPRCDAAYPGLKDEFFGLVDRLNAEPIMVSVPNVMRGGRNDLYFDGNSFLILLLQSLYNAELTSLFPILIEKIPQQDYSLLSGFLTNWLLRLEFVSMGMQISVQCHEEAVFANDDDIVESITAHPELDELFNYSVTSGIKALDFCREWGAGRADPVENEAISSDIPTLIITGEYDPVTPPSWGKQVAQTLSNHFLFEFPGEGHGASFTNDCARSVALAFLNDPSEKPQSACISDMSMSFVTPFAAGDVTFEPMTAADMSFVATVPTGWINVDGEYFVAPDRSIELVIKEILDRALEELLTSLGATEVTNEIWNDTFIWSVAEIYQEANGIAGYVATSPSEEGFFMVLVITTPDQQDAIYEPLFARILESFVLNDS